MEQILRLPAVIAATGYSRSTIYELVHKGLWCSQIRTSTRSVGWAKSEVETLISARIAGFNDNQIRTLVASLEANRKSHAYTPIKETI